MKPAKLNGSAKINRSSEIDVGDNIHELLMNASDAIRQDEIIGDEAAANGLNTLLRRVSEAPSREIDFLIGELQALNKKLGTDGNRIQRDIEEYTQLNQHVMQLTAIIADTVRKLPAVSSNS